MNVKLLIEHHLNFLNLKGCCTGSYEYTLVKMPHCWQSHATAQIVKICWFETLANSNKMWDTLDTENIAHQ